MVSCKIKFVAMGLTVLQFCLASPVFSEQIREEGSIEQVVVYQGQALVTRHVPVQLGPGAHEIVVTNLPVRVISGSLYAEGEAGINVSSTRYRERAVEEDVREEVRELDRRIDALRGRIERIGSGLGVLDQRGAYLDNLEQFVSSGAREELSGGVLNAETLMELSDYLFAQRQHVADERLELNVQKSEAEKERETLLRERSMIAGRSTRTVKEAVVFAESQDEVEAAVRLHYLVGGAGWEPSYTARVGEDRARVVLEYYASLHQQSGEDWENVRMHLSTAGPRLSSRAPELEPLVLTLESKGAEEARDAFLGRRGYKTAADAMTRLREGQLGAEMARQRRAEPERDQIWTMNHLAGEMQWLELLGQGGIEEQPAVRPGEALTVTYSLPGRASLPSRRDRQSFRIITEELPAGFSRKAVPVLSEYVYEEADAVNDTGTVLLGGPVTSYVEGEFVGEAELPTVTTGEPFVLGLGVKTGLRTGREVIDSEETIVGGNRVLKTTYRLTIENFGPDAVGVRLLERIPSEDDAQFSASLVDATHDLSDDGHYVRHQRPKGILRWDVEVPGRAAGLDEFAVEYTLRVEHDRHMTFSDPAQ